MYAAALAGADLIQQNRRYHAASGSFARRLQQNGQAQQQAYSAPQDSTTSQVSSHKNHNRISTQANDWC